MGGARYALMLARNLATLGSRVRVTLLIGDGLASKSDVERLEQVGVGVDVLPSWPSTSARGQRTSKRYTNFRTLDRPLNALRSAYHARADRARMSRLVKRLNSHDLVHFAWPYGIDPPDVNVPMTFIPHDLIHSHEFGVAAYSRESWGELRQTVSRWLARATPIVSSHFIAKELERVFPGCTVRPYVIYLSSLHDIRGDCIDNSHLDATCSRFAVSVPFVLCANNLWPHKNLGLLISALWYLRQRHGAIKLVAVGPGTEGIRAVVNGHLYGDRVADDQDWHVRGLGVVSETELLCLMRRAVIVANPSLCEAGAGSALDAWALGCAVALSDIGAFRDQVRHLGTRAFFFDPRDPRGTADVLDGALRDLDSLRRDGEASRLAIQRHDWRAVGHAYLSVFTQVIGKRQPESCHDEV